MLLRLLFCYYEWESLFTAVATLVVVFSLGPRIFGHSRRLKTEQPLSGVPTTIHFRWPVLRSTVSFVFNGTQFFLELLVVCHKYSDVLRVRLVTHDVYVVHGQKHVAEVFQNSKLSVTKAYAYALQHCFGMKSNSASIYLSDTSGSRTRPISGSKIKSSGRIGLHTHEVLTEGLLGSDLEPMTRRFKAVLPLSAHLRSFSKEWSCQDDLSHFFELFLGDAVLKSLFGPLLLETNRDFAQDLFKYDQVVMTLARQMPSILYPRAYKLRSKIIGSIKRWQSVASQTTDTDLVEDVESIWGSRMMKNRYKTLMAMDGQDVDSVASANFGLIWASITNVVPSTVIMTMQVFSDPDLLFTVREALDDVFQCGTSYLDVEKLTKIPILMSLYAETLRFGVQIHIPRDAPHHSVKIGNSILPQKSLLLMNTWLAHSDESVWNSQGGRKPLREFWPQRFLVYPGDPSSGPCRKPGINKRSAGLDESNGPNFTTEGLQGAWIPYGSGHHACPGRILAKRIMLHTVAFLVMSYDIDLGINKSLGFASPRFGFGVKKLAHRTPFRIRERPIAGKDLPRVA